MSASPKTQVDGPKGAIEKIPRKAEFKVMAPYLAKLPQGDRLLDGGCGLGDWTLYFSRNGHPTLGLDLSRATITRLKELFLGVEFAAGDIRLSKKMRMRSCLGS